jgi:hypothetical protein
LLPQQNVFGSRDGERGFHKKVALIFISFASTIEGQFHKHSVSLLFLIKMKDINFPAFIERD